MLSSHVRVVMLRWRMQSSPNLVQVAVSHQCRAGFSSDTKQAFSTSSFYGRLPWHLFGNMCLCCGSHASLCFSAPGL